MSHGADSPVGNRVPNWTPKARPGGVLDGRTCRVEPLAQRHVASLHHAVNVQSAPQLWTYYPAGPYSSAEEFRAWLATIQSNPAAEPHVITLPDGTCAGLACYLRIDQSNGSVELGNIVLSDRLQRTTPATEALFMLIRHAFDLGYRRFEWKCDSLNEPSRKAATRLGFTYEGTFRQAIVYRGRNRDTAWFSILDHEWPAIESAFTRWLSPDNFAADGTQLTALRFGSIGDGSRPAD